MMEELFYAVYTESCKPKRLKSLHFSVNLPYGLSNAVLLYTFN